MSEAPHFSVRKAVTNDHSFILEILQEVAAEIPVKLDSSEAIDAIKNIIVECCDSGDSLVACDQDENVIGFILAKPDIHEFDRALSMRYMGISNASRGKGVMSTLVDTMKSEGVPLTADVLTGNKSAMSDRLLHAGFLETCANEKQRQFRWAPAGVR